MTQSKADSHTMKINKVGKELYFDYSPSEPLEEIPVGVWSLKQNPMTGVYFLTESEPFEVPEKIYGDENDLANRYVNTYNNMSGNMGVALIGKKGTGKSLLGKLTAVKSGLPVILIGAAYGGVGFRDFITKITQDVVVFVDEFEKVYREHKGEQVELLTLLDGVYIGHKLWVFTSNSMQISDLMLNRPGRIRYLKEYDTLPREVMLEVVEDGLENQEYKIPLVDMIQLSGIATMDVMQSIIKEMNLYNENPRQAVQVLNINLERVDFDIEFLPDPEFVARGMQKISPYSGVDFHPLMSLKEGREKEIETYVQKLGGWIYLKVGGEPLLVSGNRLEYLAYVDDVDLPVIDENGKKVTIASNMHELASSNGEQSKVSFEDISDSIEQTKSGDTYDTERVTVTGKMVFKPKTKSFNKFNWSSNAYGY